VLELVVVGLLLTFWMGFRTGYSFAVRRSGWNNARGGLRRFVRGRW
jgi:hypothetical protein